MASFSKRTYQSWRVTCSEDRLLNATFVSEEEAQARLRELSEQGLKGLKVKKFSSTGWQARVRLKGFPDLNKTFPRRDLAEAWAREKEGEIVKRQFIDYRVAERTSLGDLLQQYDLKKLSGKPKDDPDRARIRKLSLAPLARIMTSSLIPKDFADYRDARLGQLKGATVKKELELFSRVIAIARREWGIYLPMNPASGEFVKRPPAEPGDERDRRLRAQHVATGEGAEPTSLPKAESAQTKRRVRAEVEYETDPETARICGLPQDEQQTLLRACRYPHWYTQRKRHVTAATLKARAKRAVRAPIKARLLPSHVIWALVSFAIETAMRRGEMLKLRWSHLHLDKGYIDLPGSITKNGKSRIVPLSLRAKRILFVQPRTSEYVFATNINTVKLGFRRALARAGSTDLRLHDLRHEATSRLFERTDLRESEIGYVTGHTDPRMLQRYYNKRPDEFVDRFHRSIKKTVERAGEKERAKVDRESRRPEVQES